VLMLTMKKDESLRAKNTARQKPFVPAVVCIITKEERISISNWNQRTHQARLVSYRQTTVIHGQNSRDKERLIANFRG
jgi:hypothetical protein